MPTAVPLPKSALGDETQGAEIAEQIRRTIAAPASALKPLLLVGAGVSSRVGLPTWGQLMDKLHAYTGIELQKRAAADSTRVQLPPKRLLTKQDYLWRAQYYCEALGSDRFEQFVAGLYSQAPILRDSNRGAVDRCMQYIVQLPVSHVLTTNYDTCLDSTHRILRETQKKNRPGPFEVINVDDLVSTRYFIQTLASPNRTRYYVHLHGRVDQRDSIVLTESSYRSRYLSNVPWARALYSVFSTRQLICVGFSATDPDLTAVLREISAMGAGVRHYAIVGIERSEEVKLESRRLEQKYGITPLLYRLNTKGDLDRHANLEAILGWLCQDEHINQLFKEPTRNRRPGAAAEIPALREGKAHSTTNRAYPDDPRRGSFGESPERDGLELSATVSVHPKDPDWFVVELTVRGGGRHSLDPNDQVQFYVHPSFPRGHYYTRPSRKPSVVAKLTLFAYGAFTVGVLARRKGSSRRTALELNLAQLPDAPAKFKSR